MGRRNLMDTLVENLTVFMLIGIIVVVGVSQFDRVVGSVLGVLFWAAVALVGGYGYSQGGSIGISKEIQFAPAVFYGLCGVLIAANVAMGVAASKRRP